MERPNHKNRQILWSVGGGGVFSLIDLQQIGPIATVDESKKARKQFSSLHFLLHKSCILTREETTKNEVFPSFHKIQAFTFAFVF